MAAAALLQLCGGVRTVWVRHCSTAELAWGRRGGGVKVAGHGGCMVWA